MKQLIDKILLYLATICVVLGIVFILIGASYTEAYEVKKVWGYNWGTKAIQVHQALTQQAGWSDYHAKLVINKCKRYERQGTLKGSVLNCIQALSIVAQAESGGFKKCYKNNCLGILYKGRVKSFNSVSENIDFWIQKYNKYWYTWKTKGGVKFFYNPYGYSTSRYCISEAGHRGIGCPNGYLNGKFIYDLIK